VEPMVDVTVTAADPDWLAVLARRLIDRRLIACGNIVTGVRSIYIWNDELQDASEVLMIMHTRASLVQQVITAVEEVHPYEVPQVVALPALAASAAYHRWVLDSTTDSDSDRSG